MKLPIQRIQAAPLGAARLAQKAAFLLLTATVSFAAQTGTADMARDPLRSVGWENLAPLPGAAPRIWSVAMSDAEPDTVYAGSSAGLLVSEDAGASWALQSRWPVDYAGYGIVDASPTDPDLVVGSFGLNGIWRSTDRGVTWAKPVEPPTDLFLQAVRFAPGCASIVYAQGFNRELWRSLDGGDHWHPFFDAGPSGSVAGFDLAHGDASRVAVHDGTHLWITRDGGLGWTRRSAPPGGNGTLRLDPFDPTRMLLTGFGRVFVSSDEAVSWSEYDVPSDSIFDAVDWDRSTPGVVHAGLRGDGLFRSSDACATWTAISGGELDRASGSPKAIRSSAQRPGQVVVGDVAGLFTSIDAGITYTDSNADLAPYAFISGIAPDPFDVDRLVVGTGGSMYVSEDRGASWARSALTPGTLPYSVQADPTTPGRFYLPQISQGLHRSDDGGLTFQLIYEEPGIGFWNCKPHPTIPGRVFAAGSGVRRSDDGGATFSGNLVGSGWAWAIEISAVDPNIVYASTGSSVMRSLDGGLTFEPAITTPPAVTRTLSADPVDANVAYATADYAGVWKTEDAGLHWTPLPESGRTATSVTPLPGFTNAWAVSMWTRHFIRLTLDGGLSFQSLFVPHGTSATMVKSTAADLYVGTEGNGVLRLVAR